MNSTLGKSIARLARSMATNEPPDKVATKKAIGSIDAEVTEATGVDVIVHKLPVNDEDPTEKEATNPPIEATGVDAIVHKLPANNEGPTEIGGTNDAEIASEIFVKLNRKIYDKWNNDLELHVIAFGSGADTTQLRSIARASPKGRILSSASAVELSEIFIDIAASAQVVETFEAEICKRVSDAVSDKLSLEYFD